MNFCMHWIQRFCFFLLVGTTACQPAQESEPFATYYPISVGAETVQVQIALNEEEQRRGLMFRESLEKDQGMLFLFPQPKQMRFWMRNTTIPLDIGYFDSEGVLQEIYQLYPRDETPVESHGEDLQIALEVNQGWFARNGIRPGAELDLSQLEGALRSRGYDPQVYNLER